MHDKIQEQIKEALRAKDSVRLTTLRGILAAFMSEAMNLKRKPQDKLTDPEAVTVIKRLAKQRKDSIEQFEKGQRPDLALSERSELRILEEFLPAQMSEEQIREIVKSKIEQLGGTKEKMGMIMGAVIKETKGEADGAVVKRLVDEMLA